MPGIARSRLEFRNFRPIAWRVASSVAQAFSVSGLLAVATFISLRIVPGDPAALILGEQASLAERLALRAKLHMDESLGRQFVRFVWGLCRGEFGESLRRPGVSVASQVRNALIPTASLALTAVSFGAVLGITLGILAAGPFLGRARRHMAQGLVLVGAVPLLAFAPLATYLLAVVVKVVPLPADPDAGLSGLLFAATLLSIPLAVHVARVLAASLHEIEKQPFFSVARAKGMGVPRVWLVHAVPPCLGPTLTVIGTQLGALLGGAIVLERLFERNGLGSLILEAYSCRDLPVLEGAVMASGLLFVGTQMMVGFVRTIIDPRTER